MTEQEKLIHNERTKLLATFLNGLGIAVFAVGGLAPFFSVVRGDGDTNLYVVLSISFCFLGGFALHYAARQTLGRMLV